MAPIFKTSRSFRLCHASAVSTVETKQSQTGFLLNPWRPNWDLSNGFQVTKELKQNNCVRLGFQMRHASAFSRWVTSRSGPCDIWHFCTPLPSRTKTLSWWAADFRNWNILRKEVANLESFGQTGAGSEVMLKTFLPKNAETWFRYWKNSLCVFFWIK